MRTPVIIGLVAIALAGCAGGAQPQSGASSAAAPASGPIETTPVTLTANQIKALHEGLRNSLKDPDSARFGSHQAGIEKPSGAIVVCGMVNAKNSYGGYTGMKPYLGQFVDAKFVPVGIGGTEIEVLSTIQVCKKYGFSI